MNYTDVISVTELRTQTSQILKDIHKGAKYIFVNNKPKAVLIDPADFDEYLTLKNKNILMENEYEMDFGEAGISTGKLLSKMKELDND